LEVSGVIVWLEEQAGAEAIAEVSARAKDMGFQPRTLRGEHRAAVVLIGRGDREGVRELEYCPGVERVANLMSPYKLGGRESKPDNTVVDVGGVPVGGDEVVLVAGPCAVESREQVNEAARAVREAGARLLRGGAYKPRTSPYSFQGLAEEGLEMLADAGQTTGMPVVTEVIAPEDVPIVARYAQMLQIGARNMQNFALLTKAGESGLPVLLKRGPSSTIEEWLLAAEYILLTGNDRVVLCERGIRTFENYTRNTLDLAAVVAVKSISHLPVIVDPSHGTGRWRMVAPLAKAAIVAGADGLMIEVHPTPGVAKSDGAQSLTGEEFRRFAAEVPGVAAIAGRSFHVERSVMS
jgi:3-deoxy-7-phosphoheptulonate synthase